MSQGVPARNCGECVYWTRLREQIGLCRRHAPRASLRSDEVAHWPQTREREVCGEGRVGALRACVSCPQCVHWRRPSAGLNPVDRGDMSMGWWARAGLCVRDAPWPSAEPGPRCFWRATGESDACGEGLERDGTAAS
jgi:hypothetical protein